MAHLHTKIKSAKPRVTQLDALLKLDPSDSLSVGQLFACLLRQREVILFLKKQRHHPKSCRQNILFLILIVPQTNVFVVTCSPYMLRAR